MRWSAGLCAAIASCNVLSHLVGAVSVGAEDSSKLKIKPRVEVPFYFIFFSGSSILLQLPLDIDCIYSLQTISWAGPAKLGRTQSREHQIAKPKISQEFSPSALRLAQNATAYGIRDSEVYSSVGTHGPQAQQPAAWPHHTNKPSPEKASSH